MKKKLYALVLLSLCASTTDLSAGSFLKFMAKKTVKITAVVGSIAFLNYFIWHEHSQNWKGTESIVDAFKQDGTVAGLKRTGDVLCAVGYHALRDTKAIATTSLPRLQEILRKEQNTTKTESTSVAPEVAKTEEAEQAKETDEFEKALADLQAQDVPNGYSRSDFPPTR